MGHHMWYVLWCLSEVYFRSILQTLQTCSHYLSFALKCSFLLRNTYIVTFHSVLLFNTLCPKICFVPHWIALRRRKGTLPWESMLANEGTTNCSFRTIILTRSSAGVHCFECRTSFFTRHFHGQKEERHISHYCTLFAFRKVSCRFQPLTAVWNEWLHPPVTSKSTGSFVQLTALETVVCPHVVRKYLLNCRNPWKRRSLYDLLSRRNMSSARDERIDHKHLFRDSDSWIALLTNVSPDFFYVYSNCDIAIEYNNSIMQINPAIVN